MLKVQCCHLF